MNSLFWVGKRVMVTGHTGFKGSWLSLMLQKQGAILCGYSLAPPIERSAFTVARVADGMTSHVADVRDLNALHKAVSDFEPEFVFHLAAQSLVRPSYDDPVETYATNVMGTVNLLEAVRRVGCSRGVLVVTSDKSYDNKEWVWGYRETEPMGGYDPYSSSKGCAELVTAAFRNSYFPTNKYSKHQCAIGSARAGNVIGGGDWSRDRLIPDLIAASRERENPIIRSPDALRPWQHVLECLSGYLVLARQLLENGSNTSEAWNFGPDDTDARPVSWIADRVSQLWGEGAAWQLADKVDHKRHEATYLKLDCSKAKNRLGWKSNLGLNEALRWTVDWYKAEISGADMRAFTLQQIESYSRLQAS
jgi:CDP-glucose 4,6-dehydratase